MSKHGRGSPGHEVVQLHSTLELPCSGSGDKRGGFSEGRSSMEKVRTIGAKHARFHVVGLERANPGFEPGEWRLLIRPNHDCTQKENE